MTKASYSIDIDVVRSRVRMNLCGFFQPSDVADFWALWRREHSRLRCAHGQHMTLLDVRQLEIQSQDAVEYFRQIMAGSTTQSLRIAVVVAKSLNRLQTRRVVEGRTSEIFYSVEEAERWLEDERRQAA